ncbi:polycomb complex protein BMI-1-A-like isoform X2 [Ostrea edulis]|uniref:polycomb complex protein BMI-1-A-like isoform X2 n=1 Tax=Ostrea edulis TaxID=37623 RepID=UPI0020964005|nr:polycomb complex protein BMI-1-A-like isoform X2 [Ostrea edulis]XP_056007888.1 polycomb complex protein BMI-1-A-like isoform X2 [Ostrea edulis]
MSGTVRIKITELNPHLICVLCGGYYIDAATIRECLHSFCRTCISKYLETTKYCPICDVMVHKTKPLQFVKSDKNLQDLVYKLVPGLYKDEMNRRREFYAAHPEDTSNPPRPTEARGYEDKDRLIYTEDEKISLALELFADVPEPIKRAPNNSDKLQQRDIRYLQCPAAVSVAHLKKFIRLKFDLPPKYTIDIYHSDEPLKDFFTLMDIAYIYTWRRTAPLRLLYTVFEQVTKKRKNTNEEVTNQIHKQPRLGDKDQENPKENKPTENCDSSSSETDQYDENSSPDENEYHTKEPKMESDESAEERNKNNADDNDNEEQKFSSSKNYKPSVNKPKLTEKDSVKNIMSGKKSTPKSLHEQGGKFFSSNFYKRKAALQADICADSPLDMTKKTLKKLKDTTTKKVGKEQSMLNGSHFPGYEFTD